MLFFGYFRILYYMKETNFLVILILWKRNVQENSTSSHSISDALEPVIKILLRLETM